MALLYLSVEVDVFRTERNEFDLVGRIGRVRIPAGDGFAVIKGEGDVLKGDYVVRHTFLGLNDIAIVAGRVEVDVVYFHELCIEPYGLALGNRVRDYAEALELGFTLVPSGETLSLCRLGRFRLQQRITFLDDLLVNLFPIYVELVGEVLVVVRPDDLCRNRVGRQHVQRQ